MRFVYANDEYEQIGFLHHEGTHPGATRHPSTEGNFLLRAEPHPVIHLLKIGHVGVGHGLTDLRV